MRVIQGDALSQLRKLPDASVQMCVTSPPYWGLRDYGSKKQIGIEETPEKYVRRLVRVFREVRRILKKDGTLWLNLGDSYAANISGTTHGGLLASSDLYQPRKNKRQKNRHERTVMMRRRKVPRKYKQKDLIGIPWLTAFALRRDGWYLRQDIIWAKKCGMPESVTDRCTRSHEHIFLLTKSPRYYFDNQAISEPATESDWESRIGRAKLNHKRAPTEQVNGIRARDVKWTPNAKDAEFAGEFSGRRNKRDVWTINPANFPELHFATYPEELVKICVLAGSKAGDTVLDPFAGSGTTGIVALELGREPILIDVNGDYVAMMNRRLNEVTPGFRLVAVEGMTAIAILDERTFQNELMFGGPS